MALVGLFGPAEAGSGPANPWASTVAEPIFQALGNLVWLGSTLVVAVAAASLIVRYRRSNGVEREQLKWLALSGFLVVAGGILILTGVLSGRSEDGFTAVGGVLFGAGLISVPIFATLAILRYRLYDIDRLISRTLSYALLTGLLAALYGVAVFVMTVVVTSLGGGSQVAVAAATLAVAAAFRPLRSRIQAAVNHRFNRTRYDAEMTVRSFAERLRDRVDVDDVQADLLSTAAGVVRPTAVQVWLRQ